MNRTNRKPKQGGTRRGIIPLVACAILILALAVVGRMYDREKGTTDGGQPRVSGIRNAEPRAEVPPQAAEEKVVTTKDDREGADEVAAAEETETPTQTGSEEPQTAATPEPTDAVPEEGATEKAAEGTAETTAQGGEEQEETTGEPEEAPSSHPGEIHPAHCSNGIFSLTEAAAAGREKLVRERLKQDYNINEHNEMGRTPLHLAVLGGHGAVVKLLLREGADVLAKDREGRTPAELTQDAKLLKVLHRAEEARRHELEVFAQLRQGNIATLKEALSKGMSPNCMDGDGQSCLLGEAAEAGNVQAVRLLLKAGAKTEMRRGDGKTPLHLAAGRGAVQVIQALLHAGADPWAQADNGASALHEAVWYGQPEAVRVLLPCYKEKNYNPNGGWSGTPVAMAINRGRVDVLQEMLRAGMRVNDPLFAEEPLLILAVKNRNAQIVQLLLKAGADKGARDARGKCAADYADDTLRQMLH